MPKEALALPELLAELPAAADYETVLDTLMATERGRGFLIEFASRNRNADTAMLVDAIARVEAAVRGEPPSQGLSNLSSANFIELTAEIERIEAELSAGRDRSSGILAAIERIQDIAFVLHERPIETTLCDGLDSAVREISDAFASSDADKAVERLHALAGKLRAATGSPTPVVCDAPGDEPPRVETRHVTAEEDADVFETDAGASPAARSFAPPGHDEPAAENAVAVAESAGTTVDAPEEIGRPSEEAIGYPLGEAFRESEAEVDDGIMSEPVEQANPLPAPGASPMPASSSEDILNQVFSDGPVADARRVAPETTSGDESPGGDILPSQGSAPSNVIDPQDDPGDLFEVALPTRAADADPDSSAPPHTADAKPESRPVAQPAPPPLPSRAAAPMPRQLPRLSASDPLAAVRTLSEEELIALFS